MNKAFLIISSIASDIAKMVRNNLSQLLREFFLTLKLGSNIHPSAATWNVPAEFLVTSTLKGYAREAVGWDSVQGRQHPPAIRETRNSSFRRKLNNCECLLAMPRL